jgi:hypothetical protein
MWGIAIDELLCKARSGEIPSKSEKGFLFIDVAPDSPTCNPPKALRALRPPTYVAVTGAELAALNAIDAPVSDDATGVAPVAASAENWRTGRRTISRLRRAPSST